MPSSPRPSKLDPFVHLLGVRTDAEVAALAALTPEAVRLYRKRRGIPSARDRQSTADQLPPEPGEAAEPASSSSGPESQEAASTEPRVSPAPRRVKRRRAGQVEDVTGPVPELPQAAAQRSTTPKAPASVGARSGRKNAEALLEPYRAQLGTVDDGAIAEMVGLSRGVVGSYRRKHNIPAYDGYLWAAGGADGVRARRGEQTPAAGADQEPARERPAAKKKRGSRAPRKMTAAAPAAPSVQSPKRRGPPSKLDAVRDLVGRLGDAEVAAKVGLTRSAVQMYRRKHNIPAPTKQASAPPERVEMGTESAPAAIEPAALPLATPAPAPALERVPTVTSVAKPAPARVAWRLTLRVGGVEVERYAITTDSASVARLGDAAGEVLRIERVGEGLE